MPLTSRVANEPVTPPNDLRPPVARHDAEIDLGPYVRLLRRKWRVVLAFMAAGAVLAAAVALSQPSIYEGVATLIVAQPKFSADAKPVNVSNFTGLLETNAIAAAAIAKFGLDKPPYEFTPTRLRRDALIIEEVRTTNLLRVRVRLTNPAMTANVANFIASEGIALNERIDSQESNDFRGQLRAQLDEAQRRLQTADQRLLDFRKTAQLDVRQKDADAALELRGELMDLSAEIESEKAKLASAEQEIKRQPPLLTAPRQVSAEAALRSTPGAEIKDGNEVDTGNPYANPVYQVLDYQIAMSRTKLASLQRRRSELTSVQRLGGRELKPLTELYPEEIRLRRLEGEHELATTLYEEIAQQYERARLQIANASARLQLVDNAVAPDAPLPRYRAVYTLLGMTGGLVLGVLFVILKYGDRPSR